MVSKTSLQGADMQSLSIYPRSDKGSRTGASVDVFVSSIEGVFSLPVRLRKKLSDADLVNWYIDLLARTTNAFKVLSVRREQYFDLPAFVVEYSDKTYDHYNEYTTSRFIFKDDTVYVLSSWYLASRKDSKAALEAIASQIRPLTDGEKRYAH